MYVCIYTYKYILVPLSAEPNLCRNVRNAAFKRGWKSPAPFMMRYF